MQIMQIEAFCLYALSEICATYQRVNGRKMRQLCNAIRPEFSLPKPGKMKVIAVVKPQFKDTLHAIEIANEGNEYFWHVTSVLPSEYSSVMAPRGVAKFGSTIHDTRC